MPKANYNYERVTFYHEGKQYSARGKTLKEAHAKAAQKKLALERGETGISGNMTVARWTADFKRALDISMGAKLYRNQIIVNAVAPDLMPYCLRHTYGTDLQDAGVPINVAKYLMGHSDISVTANIYTHISAEAIADAAHRINARNQ